MTYSLFCNERSTTGATSGAGRSNPSGAPDFTLVLCDARVAQSVAISMKCVLDYCLSFCPFSLVHYRLEYS